MSSSVPNFAVKLMLGEMSAVVLESSLSRTKRSKRQDLTLRAKLLMKLSSK
ncbi:MAG: DUF1731 domain-containing protein [Saprospiraceae bacterium]|nr:DUF1731 domain-containing protein [Candidatus Brachybacter algidus]